MCGELLNHPTSLAKLEDALAERRANQLDGNLRGLVAHIQDRVELGDLQAPQRAAVRHHLHAS